ncbi:putative ribosomal protein L6 [Naematelia encephala]|uniref:Putative ribosomal protein L6 n=1 Tax=Naematelia encephala TaxID=71784 RepID=A0A1Y2BIZ8_9TREE|nr:putative ribosomal protein L6 [Naematelia encephala]
MIVPQNMLVARRAFHTTARAASHVGSAPITIPPSVKIEYPPLSISPDLPMASPMAQRFLRVTGPLGSQVLSLRPSVILNPPASEVPTLSVTVHNPTQKWQNSSWGKTRTLIDNAIKGVSEGYTVELRLVGVGYRASVEPIPEKFRLLQTQMPRKATRRGPGSPPYVEPPPPVDRINLKVGYSHPVLIDIPTDLSVTCSAPTKILLKGIDKQKLGLFAASIRKWRKPEPYRGKVCHACSL